MLFIDRIVSGVVKSPELDQEKAVEAPKQKEEATEQPEKKQGKRKKTETE